MANFYNLLLRGGRLTKLHQIWRNLSSIIAEPDRLRYFAIDTFLRFKISAAERRMMSKIEIKFCYFRFPM